MKTTSNSEKALVARAKRLQATANATSWELADTYAELKRRGWTVRRVAEECETNKDTVSRFVRTVERCIGTDTRPSFWKVYAEVTGERAVHVSQATGQPEWYTPAEYIEAARQVLGGIDLDPASSETAQDTVQAKNYYTAKEDGLSREWAGRIWLNPPYSADMVGRFVSKLVSHVQAGDVPAALLLVNNATETEWFQGAAECASAVCFPDGRIRFWTIRALPAHRCRARHCSTSGRWSTRSLSISIRLGFVHWCSAALTWASWPRR